MVISKLETRDSSSQNVELEQPRNLTNRMSRVEKQSELYTDRIDELVELEEEIAQRQRVDDQEPEVDETGERVADVAYGTIEQVQRAGDDRIRISVRAEGDVEKSTIAIPEELPKPDSDFQVLCNVCGVEPNRVANLQGKMVPVRFEGGTHHLLLPSTTRYPAYLVFQAWMRMKRYRLIERGKTAGYWLTGVGGTLLYVLGVNVLLHVFSDPNMSNAELIENAVPFVSSFGPGFAADMVSLVLIFLGSLSLLASVPVLLFVAALMGDAFDRYVNPF